jgi:uncharacterized damage-inducible protein DinB
MDEKSLFTRFWANEAKTTKKVFARIPDKHDYKPDAMSRTAQQIAWQIYCEESMIMGMLETLKVEAWKPLPMPDSMAEITEMYSKQSDDIVDRLKKLPETKWNGSLDFFGKQRSASEMAWSFLFDIVHHRGQITTYLRPMGSKVPQIYGPSGDEPNMAP